MIPIKFDRRIVEANPDAIFDNIQFSWTQDIVTYIINSDFRKAVNLKFWLKSLLLKEPSEKMVKILSQIPDIDDPDLQTFACYQWVVKYIIYRGDLRTWKMSEYWQTPEETVAKMTGDCEDGTLLLAYLASHKGVSSNRWLIWCGKVDYRGATGGHCTFFYRPTIWPLNPVVLDWCYYPDTKTRPNDRSLFYMHGRSIQEWSQIDNEQLDSMYRKTWFVFNDEIATRSLELQWR